jgi:hypothetical protein
VALGEQPDRHAGRGQHDRDQQHAGGEGAASRLPPCATGELVHAYSQTPYQTDPGKDSP